MENSSINIYLLNAGRSVLYQLRLTARFLAMQVIAFGSVGGVIGAGFWAEERFGLPLWFVGIASAVIITSVQIAFPKVDRFISRVLHIPPDPLLNGLSATTKN